MLACWLSALLASAPSAVASTGGAVWLEEGVGARWIGMGSAARASARDVHAAFWNPAALSAIGPENWQIGSMLTFQSLDRTVASLSGAWQTDRSGTYALTWMRRSVGGLERVDDQGVVTETTSGAADAFLVSGGWAILYQVRAGVTAKVLRESVFDSSATGVAGDIGLLVQPFLGEELWLALTVENAAASVNWSGLAPDTPARAPGGGVAWWGWRDRLLLAADAVSRSAQDGVAVHAGAEVWPVVFAAVRAGWNDGHLAAGATYMVRPYEFDYAFAFDSEVIGTRHQVSFLLHF